MSEDSPISPPIVPGQGPPPGAPPPPGQPPPPEPQPADEDVEKCEGCGELVPEGTLRESEDMVSLCPKCMALDADEPAEPQETE